MDTQDILAAIGRGEAQSVMDTLNADERITAHAPCPCGQPNPVTVVRMGPVVISYFASLLVHGETVETFGYDPGLDVTVFNSEAHAMVAMVNIRAKLDVALAAELALANIFGRE